MALRDRPAMQKTLLSLMIASLGVGLTTGATASEGAPTAVESPSASATLVTQTQDASSVPSVSTEAAMNETRLDAVVDGLSNAENASDDEPTTTENVTEETEGESAQEETATDVGEESTPDVANQSTTEENKEANFGAMPAVADQTDATKALEETSSEDTKDVQALRTPDSVSPLAIVPPFLDFMPYVTSLKDVEEVFGKAAHLYEEGRYGKRHIITGQDFDLGVTSILVYYTDQGLLSDVFLRIPSERRSQVLESLRKMADDMSADGLWAKEGERDIWRTKTAELSIGPANGKDFSVEYGATARQVRETRAWLEADPEHRTPRFAGLTIGISTAKDIQAKADGKRCRILGPSPQKDGSTTYALTGKCFGIPGEYQSLAWIAADNGRLTRLFIQSRGDSVGFASVLPALQKRYKPTQREGEFQVGDAVARNIWPPTIRWTPYKKTADGSQEEGTLEFYAGIDGVKKAESKWDILLEEKKAREAQAKAVDQLFE